MPLPRILLPLATAAALALAVAPAQAAGDLTASRIDPRDGTGGAHRDLYDVRTAFSPDAGRWTVRFRLHGGPSADEWAMANATLWAPGSSKASCVEGARSVATYRASTRPEGGGLAAQAGASGEPNPIGGFGPSPFTGGADKRLEGDEIVLEGQDQRLVGREVACITMSLSSQNTTLDSLDGGLRFGEHAPGLPPEQAPPAAPGTPAPEPPAQGPMVPTAPQGLPRIMLAPNTKRFTTDRSGLLAIRLRPFDRDVVGDVKVSRHGRALGRGTFRAKVNRPVAVTVRLNAAGRALARQGRAVRLTVSLRTPDLVTVRKVYVKKLVRG